MHEACSSKKRTSARLPLIGCSSAVEGIGALQSSSAETIGAPSVMPQARSSTDTGSASLELRLQSITALCSLSRRTHSAFSAIDMTRLSTTRSTVSSGTRRPLGRFSSSSFIAAEDLATLMALNHIALCGLSMLDALPSSVAARIDFAGC